MSEPSQSVSAIVPNKRYFTIGEVSQLCQVKDHVLRYWESKVPKLRPQRRQGRRYYRREDVLLVRQIHGLMKHEGYTLEGAWQKLEAQPPAQESPQMQAIQQAVVELEEVLHMLRE